MSAPAPGRRQIVLIAAIIVGFIAGMLIKKVRIGILFGLLLGILIVAMSRSRRSSDRPRSDDSHR
jgi:hypothetical protein